MLYKLSRLTLPKRDRVLWSASIGLLIISAIYQVLKSFIPFAPSHEHVDLVVSNYFSLIIFFLIMTFILFRTRKIGRHGYDTVILFVICGTLIFSYLNLRERRWEKGMDVTHDFYKQTEMIAATGLRNYISNYNSYGKPAKEIEEATLKYLSFIGIEKNAAKKWSRSVDAPSPSYLSKIHHFTINPPLSNIICFFWMKIAGFSHKALDLFIILCFAINLGALYLLLRLVCQKSMAILLCFMWMSNPNVLEILHPPALEPILALFLLGASTMYYMGQKLKQKRFDFLTGLVLGLAMYVKFTAIPVFLTFTVLYAAIGILHKSHKKFFMFIFGAIIAISLFSALGYNIIYTVTTTALRAKSYKQLHPISYIRLITQPLYLGVPFVLLMLSAIKWNIDKLVKNRLGSVKTIENFLYCFCFISMYIIYYRWGIAHRYVMPYLPFMLIVIGRYIGDKDGIFSLSRYNYIFIYNFIFIALSQLL
jgi:hypothetical protein